MIKRASRKSTRGFALLETMIATMIMIVILLGIFGLLFLQLKTTADMTLNTKANFILQGEMEWLRAASPAGLAECTDEEFTPFLEVPESLQRTTWKRTIHKSGDGLIHLKLTAAIEGIQTYHPLNIEGVLNEK